MYFSVRFTKGYHISITNCKNYIEDELPSSKNYTEEDPSYCRKLQ